MFDNEWRVEADHTIGPVQDAAFGKPPGTALRILLRQHLLPVGPFKFIDFLFNYLRSATVILDVVWMSSTGVVVRGTPAKLEGRTALKYYLSAGVATSCLCVCALFWCLRR